MKLFRIVICCILLSSCAHYNELGCPVPGKVRLKRAAMHRLKYQRAKRREIEAERASLAGKVYDNEKLKELKNIEEWDCPRPGSRHDRLVQDKRKRIEKKYEDAMRRRAKESEDFLSATTTSGESNQ